MVLEASGIELIPGPIDVIDAGTVMTASGTVVSGARTIDIGGLTNAMSGGFQVCAG